MERLEEELNKKIDFETRLENANNRVENLIKELNNRDETILKHIAEIHSLRKNHEAEKCKAEEVKIL